MEGKCRKQTSDYKARTTLKIISEMFCFRRRELMLLKLAYISTVFGDTEAYIHTHLSYCHTYYYQAPLVYVVYTMHIV